MSTNSINQMTSFTFETSPSDIRIDSISNNVNLPPEQSVKLCPIDSKILRFAYTPGYGLIKIGEANKKRVNNLLGEFLKVKSNDYNSLLYDN